MGYKKPAMPVKVSKIPLIIALLCLLLPFYFYGTTKVASGTEIYVFLYFFLLGIVSLCYYPLHRISCQNPKAIEKIPLAIVLLVFFSWVHYYFFFRTGINTRILLLIVIAAFAGALLRLYVKKYIKLKSSQVKAA